MIKFAVISFPGNNCELESVRGFKRNGMDAEIVLWNDKGLLDGSRLAEFDGYCIPGGFSYEDRGRSGVVAAQDPVMKVITREADAGKVVLGICNGAQILVETGLIPGFEDHSLSMGLAWNEMRVGNKIVDTGFYNVWVDLKNAAPLGRCAFNNFEEVIQIPIAHGEGRFVMDSKTLKQLEENNQIVFKYCDADGHISADFPITPNGAMASAAAICNPAGNVMGIMPHPERDPAGSGNQIFQSIKGWIEDGKKADYQPLGKGEAHEDVRPLEKSDMEILVKLIITDNTERTIEEALIRQGFGLHLDRYEYYGIKLHRGLSVKEALLRIMASGELANFNKHFVLVRSKEGVFSYHPETGLKPKELSFDSFLVATDQKDFVGQSKLAAINLHSGLTVEALRYGVLWNVSQADTDTVDRVIQSKVLYNPNSMYLMKA